MRPVKTIDQSLLGEVANLLAKELHPEGIWLFGSHAWGTPDEGSDLDLFAVVAESGEPPIERMRRAHRCLRGLGIAKDVLVKTRQQFDRLRALPSTLVYLAFRRGRKLYGRHQARMGAVMADQSAQRFALGPRPVGLG